MCVFVIPDGGSGLSFQLATLEENAVLNLWVSSVLEYRLEQSFFKLKQGRKSLNDISSLYFLFEIMPVSGMEQSLIS